jgi:subtilisin family serine protease
MSEAEGVEILRREGPEKNYSLNHRYRLNADPCQGERCFGQELIGWPRPDGDSCRQSVRIGLIDTAVDRKMAGIGLLSLLTERFSGRRKPSDTTHGTAVAALLAGSPQKGYPGLLPEAKIYVADVFRTNSRGESHTTASAIAEAINWLMESQVHVINISLAGPANSLLERAVTAAYRGGVPLVAAAGNGGPDARPAYPAAYHGVIAVTAVDMRLRPYLQANRGDYIALAAPGVGIWTPSLEGGTYQSGTSFAAPFVSAVVASLNAQGRATSATVEGLLAASATDLGPPGKDQVYGWGLVQGIGVCE